MERRTRWLVAGWAALVVVGCGGGNAGAGGGTLSGTVSLTGVSDASGVRVTVSGPSSGSAVTDAKGHYSVTALKAGSYLVVAHAGWSLEKTAVVAANVSKGGKATAPAVTFTATGALKGTVQWSGGDPTGAVVVVAGTSATATVDSSGAFVLSSVPVGTHTVVASLTGAGTASATGVAVDYAKTDDVPALVLGGATATGTGSVSGTIRLVGSNDASGVTVSLAGPVSAAAVTGTGGTYAFTGLPDGTYAISATAPSTVEGAVETSATVSGGAATTAPDLSLTAAGALSGTVTLGGQTTGNAGIAVFVAGGSAVTFTDDAGAYRLPKVPVGTTELEATHTGYQVGTEPGLTVTRGQTTTVPDLALAAVPAGGADTSTVVGRVDLMGSTDPSGVTVTLTGDAGALPPVTTAADGTFTVTGVPAGVYSASFVKNAYQETTPTMLLALPGTGGYWVDQALYPLATTPVPVSTPRLAPAQGAKGLAISQDGSEAMYLTDIYDLHPNLGDIYHGDPSNQTGTLHVVPTAGGASMALATDASVPNAFVSDDGSHALFVNAYDASIPMGTLNLGSTADGSVTVLGHTLVGLGSWVVSPNRRYTWFWDVRDPSTWAGTMILADLDTGATQDLGPVGSGWFAGDGANLLYLSSTTGVTVNGNSVPMGTLNAVAGPAGTPMVLGTGVLDGSDRFAGWAWQDTPDHGHVLFWANATPSTLTGDLTSASLTDGSTAVLASGVPMYSYAIAYSPDGSHVVFASSYDASLGTVTLEIAPVAGGATVSLGTGIHGVSGAPAFTPDGSEILLFAGYDPSTGVGTLQMVPTTGGTAANLATTTLQQVVLAPDGAHVAYVDGSGALYVVPAAGGPALALGTAVDTTFGTRFSPDGTQLAFLDNLSTSTAMPTGTLELADVTTGTVTPLQTDVEANYLRAFAFSKDGTQLVFELQTGQVLDVVSTADGSVTTLGDTVSEWRMTASGEDVLLVGHPTGAPAGTDDDMIASLPAGTVAPIGASYNGITPVCPVASTGMGLLCFVDWDAVGHTGRLAFAPFGGAPPADVLLNVSTFASASGRVVGIRPSVPPPFEYQDGLYAGTVP